MKKNNGRSSIMMSVLILFVCVAATTIALTGRLNNYVLDDSGAISLISGNSAETLGETTAVETTEPATETEENTTEESTVPMSDITHSANNNQPSTNHSGNYKPGFEISDDNTVWTTNTEVEIFKIAYENGEQNITVKSDNGEKVFAPGTSNSYTFKLKNTGNVAVDYTVEVDAYFTPADTIIPITARLNRYDGLWLVGDKDNYADIPALDSAEDAATLGAGKYTYYTLDWQWPFEGGNDEFDTMLGNMAADGEELTLTIVINTTAEADYEETSSPGITPPQTGDLSQLDLLVIIAAGASFLMIILIIVQIKDKKNKEEKKLERN